jgi:hypothetical protein
VKNRKNKPEKAFLILCFVPERQYFKERTGKAA